MNHDSRANKSAASREVLHEVIALGVSQGKFEIVKTAGDDGDNWRWVDVVTPAGLLFSLSGGSWGKEGSITARVAAIDRDNIRILLSDTPRRNHPVEAACSYARGAATILKDLTRRVIEHPDGIAGAQAVRDTWQARIDARAALRGHVKTLEALGDTFQLDARETYAARGYGSTRGVSDVRVNSEGYVTFDASCQVEQFAAVLHALGSS